MIFLSIVIPVFNDAEVLPELFRRLQPVCEHIVTKQVTDKIEERVPVSYEIICVEDGSSDDSFSVLKKFRNKNKNIKIIKLKKNYGQSNAITAGLENAKGKIIVVMDADLQDNPTDIIKLVAALQESGSAMVLAKWSHRKISLFRKSLSKIFWSFANFTTETYQPPETGVFRAFKRETYEKVKNLTDNRSTTLSGFHKAKIDFVTVEVEREKRLTGKSGYNVKKMFKLAFDRILPNLKYLGKFFERKPKYEIEKILE